MKKIMRRIGISDECFKYAQEFTLQALADICNEHTDRTLYFSPMSIVNRLDQKDQREGWTRYGKIEPCDVENLLKDYVERGVVEKVTISHGSGVNQRNLGFKIL